MATIADPSSRGTMIHILDNRNPFVNHTRMLTARNRRGQFRLRPSLESLESRALMASIEGLGILTSRPTRTVIATAVSADGSTVVGGESLLPSMLTLPIGFRWTENA